MTRNNSICQIKKGWWFVCKGNSGFTIIELLIAIGLFSILLVLIWSVFSPFQIGYQRQQSSIDVIQKARSGMSYLSDEIKLAGLDPEESGKFSILVANDAEIEYTFDRPDPDNSDKFDGEVTYSLTRPERRAFVFQGGELIQNDYNTINHFLTETLVDHIDMSISKFSYFDSDRKPITSPVSSDRLADIRFVRITLNVLPSDSRSEGVFKTLVTEVRCINMHFNSQRDT